MKIPRCTPRARLAFMASTRRSTASMALRGSSTRCSTVQILATTGGGCSSRTTNRHRGDILGNDDRGEPSAMKDGIAAVGDVLAGKYRVDKILGIGGMGMVVAATHLELDQRVALKFMLPNASESPETA